MPVPPLVLVTGPEELLAERAVASTVDELRVTQPDLEVVRLSAATYVGGELLLQTSPSLFGGSKAVVVEGAEELGDDLQTDLLGYLAAPADDVTLVVRHRSGQRGKKVLDALRKQGARVLECPAVKDHEKPGFAQHEFRRLGRRATPEAVGALVQAVGKDLRELAAACAQLVADTEGTIDETVVERYHGGKVETTGFKVAEAAVAGDSGEALRLLRHAISTGVDPVPIVAVLALQLRQLVKVGAAGRGARPRSPATSGWPTGRSGGPAPRSPGGTAPASAAPSRPSPPPTSRSRAAVATRLRGRARGAGHHLGPAGPLTAAPVWEGSAPLVLWRVAGAHRSCAHVSSTQRGHAGSSPRPVPTASAAL